MPLNPDGTYTAGMPSTYDLIGGAPPQAAPSSRGMDVLRGVREPRKEKPQQSPINPPTFVDWVKFKSKQDGTSLTNADDATYINYAKDYAENVLPGVLSSRGTKVDKHLINTVSQQYQMKTAENLQKLRDHFKNEQEQLTQGPPAPEKPGMLRQGWNALKGAGNTALNVGQESLGTLAGGLGEAIHGTAGLIDRIAEAGGLANPNLSPEERAFIKQKNLTAGHLTDVTQPFYENQKEAQKTSRETLDPEYQKAISQEAPFSATKAASFTGNTIANAIPTLSAFLANPLAGIAVGSGQTGESVKNSVEDRVMNASPEELKNTPEFQNLLKTMSPEQAKSTLAKQAGDKAFMTAAGVGGLVSAATGGATSGLLQSGLKRAGINALLPRIITTAGLEAPVQGGLNVLTQATGNQAVNEALNKPDASSFEGAGQAFGEGAAAGAVLGPLGTLIHAAGNRLANQRAEPSGIDVLKGKANEVPAKAKNLAQGQEQSVAPTETKTTPQQAAPRESSQNTTAPVNNSVITDPQVAEAVRLGLQEAPIPKKEQMIADPLFAKRSMENYLDAVEPALVEQGISSEKMTELRPQLEAEWLRRAELKPEDLVPKPEKAPEEATAKQPATQEAPAETAPVREELTKIVDESTQAESVPQSTIEVDRNQNNIEALITQEGIDPKIPTSILKDVAENLTLKLNREPTAKELNFVANDVATKLIRQDGVDFSIPVQARVEAVGELIQMNPNRLPTPEEINLTATNIATTGKSLLSDLPLMERVEKRSASINKNKQIEEAYKARERPLNEEISRQKEADFAELDKENTLLNSQKTAFQLAMERARKAQKIKSEKAKKGIDVLKKKSDDSIAELAFNAAQDISVEPTGRTVEQVRSALTEKIGEKAVAALEKSGVLRFAQGIKDIPEQYQREGISGVYTPERQAYLIADHITPGAEWRTLVHEVGVHYGLPTMLKPGLYKQLETYIESNRLADTPEGKEIAAAWQSAEGVGTNPKIQTNETIAHMVQSRLAQVPGSIWNRALTAIRAFMFDKIGRYLPSGISKKLINNAVITQLAKSATGRAAKLRESEMASQQVNAGLDVPAYNKLTDANTAERVAEAIKLKPEEKQPIDPADIHSMSKLEKSATWWFNNLRALQYANEKLYKKGTPVTPDADLLRAATLYKNKSVGKRAEANEKFVEPTLNWVVSKARDLNIEPREFVDQLNNFYLGKRALEVNKRFELENIKLNKEADAAREAIVQKFARAELAPGEYIKQLEAVVNAPGALKSDKRPSPGSGIPNKEARMLVVMAKKAGITEDILAESEPMRKAMVEFTNKNNMDSQLFSGKDEARREALGSEWYVPLRGFADADPGVNYEGPRSGAHTREYSLAEGRDTISQNPWLSLLQDTLRSSEDVAWNEVTGTALKFARKYGEQNGIKVKSFKVEKAREDKILGGELKKAYKNKNTIIHNAGEYQYSITFPENSEIFNAIKGLKEFKETPKWQELVGKSTNVYGRSLLKANPTYLFWNQFWNDLVSNTAQMGADYGPVAALKYVGNYIGSGGPFGTLRVGLSPTGKVRSQSDIVEYAKQNPNFKLAQEINELIKYGGDDSIKRVYNDVSNVYRLHDRLKEMSKNGLVNNTKEGIGKVYDVFSKYVDALGDASNRIGRASALKTYKSIAEKAEAKRLKRELTPQEKEQIAKDGSYYSKKLLDFQQTSEGGQLLNTFLPFMKIGITQSDRILQTVRNPDGSTNYKKVAKLMAFGSASAILYYAFARQDDPKIKEQSNDTVANYLLIPNPGGDGPIKIPMKYGISQLLFTPALMAARVAFGDTDKREAASVLRDSLTKTLSPFQLPQASYHQGVPAHLGDVFQSLMPWFIDPGISLLRNKNNFGGPITPTFENKNKFKSDSGLASTPDQWKWLSNQLREWTGVDAYPESLRFISSEYGGSPVNELLRWMTLADKANKGQDIQLKDVKSLPSIISRDSEYYPTRRLGEVRSDLEDHRKQLEHDNKKSKNPVDISKLHTPKLDLLRSINSMQKKNNDERKDVLSSKLPEKTKTSRLDALRAKYNKDANAIIKAAERMK